MSLCNVVARPVLLFSLTLSPAVCGFSQSSADQHTLSPQGTVKYGYAIHQPIDLGGHVADYSGSGAMYDTLVNLQTGPRILSQSLDMHATEGSKHFLFDTLFATSAGYGGDPNDFTVLRMSQGRLYEFNGTFRRDRQYFDCRLELLRLWRRNADRPNIAKKLPGNLYTLGMHYEF